MVNKKSTYFDFLEVDSLVDLLEGFEAFCPLDVDFPALSDDLEEYDE